MNLQNDVDRCAGVGSDEEGWREGCDDCLRRTAKRDTEIGVWMKPPPIIVFECEYRINAALNGAEGVRVEGTVMQQEA